MLHLSRLACCTALTTCGWVSLAVHMELVVLHQLVEALWSSYGTNAHF